MKLNSTLGDPFSRFLLLLAFLFTVVALIFSIQAHRPLFADGGIFAIVELQWRQWNFQHLGLRFTSAVLEAPGLLVLWLFPGQEITTLFLRTMESSFTFQWAPGLLWCWWVCRKAGKRDLFLYPLLGFAFSGMLVIAFSAAVINEVSSLFWPLLISLTLLDLKQKSSLAVCSFLAILLGATHEAAIICWPAIWLATFWLNPDQGRVTQKGRLYLLGLSVLGIISCVVRYFSFKYASADAFFTEGQGLILGHDWYLLVQLALLGLFLLFRQGFTGHSAIRKQWLLMVLGLGWIVFAWWKLSIVESAMWTIHSERVCLPFICGLMGGLYLLEQSGRWSSVWTQERRFWARGIVTVALVLAAARDLSLTKDWSIGAKYLQQQIQGAQALCVEIPKQEFQDRLAPYGFWDGSVGVLSILLQESRHPKAIVQAGTLVDACANFYKESALTVMDWRMPMSAQTYFFPPE